MRLRRKGSNSKFIGKGAASEAICCVKRSTRSKRSRWSRANEHVSKTPIGNYQLHSTLVPYKFSIYIHLMVWYVFGNALTPLNMSNSKNNLFNLIIPNCYLEPCGFCHRIFWTLYLINIFWKRYVLKDIRISDRIKVFESWNDWMPKI